jgi:hypothetical protein
MQYRGGAVWGGSRILSDSDTNGWSAVPGASAQYPCIFTAAGQVGADTPARLLTAGVSLAPPGTL